MNARILVVAAALGCLAFTVAAGRQNTPAQPSSPEPSDNLHAVLEVFRSDVNTSKIRTLNQVMKMTASEAEKFWPIYRQYETDLASVSDRKVALIREFIVHQKNGTLTNENAGPIADKWFAVTQDRLDLWKKYHKKISDAVSPVRAAQFLQVEHQISLLIDINIASEMPMVGQPPKTEAPAGKP